MIDLLLSIFFSCSFGKAEVKKAEGNKEYVQKHYEEALKLYTEAIGVFCIGFFVTLSKVLRLFIDLIQKIRFRHSMHVTGFSLYHLALGN